MPTKVAEPPAVATIEELIRLAADEATVLLPDGAHTVKLRRLDGKKPTKALLAAVEAFGASAVCEAITDLGIAYWRAVDRMAAEYVDSERAFRIAAVGWLHTVVPSDRILVLPAAVVNVETDLV